MLAKYITVNMNCWANKLRLFFPEKKKQVNVLPGNTCRALKLNMETNWPTARRRRQYEILLNVTTEN
jgi:hypothetical protein